MWIFVKQSAAAPTLWTPSELGSLSGWWDASASNTVFDADVGGTTPTPNGFVLRWEDRSGGGHNALNASSTNTYQSESNTINGLPTVRFTGASRIFTVAHSAQFHASSGLTAMLVMRSSQTGANEGPIGKWATSAGGEEWALISRHFTAPSDRPSAVLRSSTAGSHTAIGTASVTTGSPLLFGASFNPPAGFVRVWTNGANDGEAPALSSRSVTAPLSIGSYRTGSGAFDGDIGEIVVFQSAAASDRERVEGYLAWKWGLEANLPAGHPYENAAP